MGAILARYCASVKRQADHGPWRLAAAGRVRRGWRLLPGLEPASSGRSGGGLGWCGAAALPRLGGAQVSEDPPNDRRIVEGGDQA